MKRSGQSRSWKPFGARVRIVLVTMAVFLCPVAAQAYASETIWAASGGVDVAFDSSTQALYSVQQYDGRLVKMPLVDGDGGDIVTGLQNPENLVLDLAHGCAFVTEHEDTVILPGFPRNGWLTRVELDGTKKVSRILELRDSGAQQQIALDADAHMLYSFEFGIHMLPPLGGPYTPYYGLLQRTDIDTQQSDRICQLANPIGLVLSKTKQFAYVTDLEEESAGHWARGISRISLSTGARDWIPVSGGFTGRPYFLAWANRDETALYLSEQKAGASGDENYLWRIDLTRAPALPQLVYKCSYCPPPAGAFYGIAADAPERGQVFVASHDSIVGLDLGLPSSPVFMGVGFVPVNGINETPGSPTCGYADTITRPELSGYFYKVRDVPFGGTLNIFANLETFAGMGAVCYRVESKLQTAPDSAFKSLTPKWTNLQWDPAHHRFEALPMEADSDNLYRIITSTSGAPLYLDNLLLRWPTEATGLYTLRLTLYKFFGPLLKPFSPDNSDYRLTLMLDNHPPHASIDGIGQGGPDFKTSIAPCGMAKVTATSEPANYLQFSITASDDESNLSSWSLVDMWGDNLTDPIAAATYDTWPAPGGSYHVPNVAAPYDATGKICAHTIYLVVWGRAINGYDATQRVEYHVSFTITKAP